MQSWSERSGHRWKSVGKNIHSGKWIVRCAHCGTSVGEDGHVTTNAKGFGAGKKKGGDLREWIEAALPACTSLEKIVFQVMED